MYKLVIQLIIVCLCCISSLHADPNNTKISANSPVHSKLHQREIIILVHGLMRSYLSMQPLQRYLEKQGYEVYYYNYPSTKYSIQQHGTYLKRYIHQALITHPQTTIHFITHSLGGIVTREALAQLSAQELKQVGFLIMLAPPNQGSWLAKFLTSIPGLAYFIKPLPELSSDKNAYVHSVPIPKVKTAIITGRLDIKVPPTSARLDEHASLVLVNATHTFIINHGQTQKLISYFLEKGTFEGEMLIKDGTKVANLKKKHKFCNNLVLN